jgi:U3 small nucleolar RNA-associated protein 19
MLTPRQLLAKHPKDCNLPINLLSFLERLNTFPTEPSELNAWWVEELGTKPKVLKEETVGEPENELSDGSDTEDNWTKFFDDENSGKGAPTTHASLGRNHKLNLHQSLHSLSSHRAVFSQAWLALLPRLSMSADSSRALVLRALNVMHRGVIPHLSRPILIMDWIGSCVDYGMSWKMHFQILYFFPLKKLESVHLSIPLILTQLSKGGTVGLLALNALFLLMKEHNLFVRCY